MHTQKENNQCWTPPSTCCQHQPNLTNLQVFLISPALKSPHLKFSRAYMIVWWKNNENSCLPEFWPRSNFGGGGWSSSWRTTWASLYWSSQNSKRKGRTESSLTDTPDNDFQALLLTETVKRKLHDEADADKEERINVSRQMLQIKSISKACNLPVKIASFSSVISYRACI